MAARRSQWAIILLRGGHFAAAVFEVPPPSLPGQQEKRRADGPAAGTAADGDSKARGQRGAAEGKWEAVVHKSMHRYVVR